MIPPSIRAVTIDEILVACSHRRSYQVQGPENIHLLVYASTVYTASIDYRSCRAFGYKKLSLNFNR